MSVLRPAAWMVVSLFAVACNDRYTIGVEHPATSSGGSTSHSSATQTSTGASTEDSTGASTETESGTSGHASTGAGSESDASGAALCSAEIGPTSCETCLADACCDPLLACQDLDSCQCVLACRIEGHSLESCQTDCDGATPVVDVLHECSFDGCEACF